MKNDTLLLALYFARSQSGDPLSRWDAWNIVESEYPGLAGTTRSTIYRTVDRLVKKQLLEVIGTAPGRAQEKQLLAITPTGVQTLQNDIGRAEVEVHDLRCPKMSFSGFMNYLVLGLYLGQDHIESALERRIRSLKDTLRQGLKPVGEEGMSVLLDALEHQAKIELAGLEHFLSLHRQGRVLR